MALAVGTIIENRSDFDAAPPGTVIEDTQNHRYTYTRRNDRWNREGDRYSANDFELGRYRVITLGGDEQETAAQYKQRVRDHVLRAASNHGIQRAYVNAALTQVGVGEDVTYPGRVIPDADGLAPLPIGSMVAVGNPATYDAFGLFEKTGRGWHHIIGGRTRVTVPAVVEEIPGLAQAKYDAVTDPLEITRFKAAIWKVGMRLKREQRWCETYERIMADVGIDRSCLAAGVVRLDATDVRNFRRGSIFGMVTEVEDRWAFFRRVAGVDNTAGTRRIMGERGRSERHLGHFSDSMYLLYDSRSGEPMLIPGTRAQMLLAPVGSQMMMAGDPTVYTKRGDDRWVSDHGTYRQDQFSDVSLEWTFFPEVTA